MRYLSLHLPFLATDRIRRRIATERTAPPEAAHGPAPLATSAKVKSAYRLMALDADARALGLKPMVALADARAMHPGLHVHEADPAGDLACRDALVDWCRLFTPLAAPDGDDGIVLDVTGAAHLHGGEMALMATMVARLAAQGFAATMAVAASSGAAWALARHGRGGETGRRRLADDLDLAATQRVFAPMPLAALRLDEAALARLAQAGLRRVGDLLLRPRAPIAARFGRDIHRRLDALLGLSTEPISPRFEAPAFVAERRFAEGIARREDVEGTILSLSYDLCGLLARHGEGARRLDVALYRVDGLVKHLEAGTSRPLRDPIAMARLFRERIEAAGEDGLDTGYGFEMVRLAATSAERLDQSQPGWDAAAAGETDVADLVDRLGARFGLERVTRLQLANSHQPERAAVALSAARPARGATAVTIAPDDQLATLPERPIRLFERPEPIETVAEVPDGPPLRFRWRRMLHQVAAIEGPERIGPEWWKQDSGGTRDYFRAENTKGQRFWLFREGLYRDAVEPRWYLHGIFA